MREKMKKLDLRQAGGQGLYRLVGDLKNTKMNQKIDELIDAAEQGKNMTALECRAQ